MKKNHDIVEITAEIRRETKRTYLLYDGEREELFTKSNVRDNGDGTFSMPEWVARDKGFI